MATKNGKRLRPTAKALSQAHVRAAAAENREESLKQRLAASEHELGQVRSFYNIEREGRQKLGFEIDYQRSRVDAAERAIPEATIQLPGVTLTVRAAPAFVPMRPDHPYPGGAQESANQAAPSRGLVGAGSNG